MRKNCTWTHLQKLPNGNGVKGIATNVYPWMWNDVSVYNDAGKNFLKTPPEKKEGYNKYGFDKDGNIIFLIEYEQDYVFDVKDKLPGEYEPVYSYDLNKGEYIDSEFKNGKFFGKSLKSSSYTVDLSGIKIWKKKTTKRDYHKIWVMLNNDEKSAISFFGGAELDESGLKEFHSYNEQYFDKGIPSYLYDMTNEKKYSKLSYEFSDNGKLLKVNYSEEKISPKKSLDDILKNIEKKYNAVLPDSFKQLYLNKDNLFGNNYEEWKVTFKERAFNNPPALLCARNGGVEWIKADDILDWEFPDYWDGKHKMIPFAGNGCGDVWAFYLNWTDKENIPVIFAYHDENRAEAYAPDFESFLFKQMLESFLEINSYDLKGLACDTPEQYR
jgi:hypothetical protein